MDNDYSLAERAVVGELLKVAEVCDGSREPSVRAFAGLVRERAHAIVVNRADLFVIDDEVMRLVTILVDPTVQ